MLYYAGRAMKAVTVREANQGFSELLAQVEHGEEVLITKRGRPVESCRATVPRSSRRNAKRLWPMRSL